MSTTVDIAADVQGIASWSQVGGSSGNHVPCVVTNDGSTAYISKLIFSGTFPTYFDTFTPDTLPTMGTVISVKVIGNFDISTAVSGTPVRMLVYRDGNYTYGSPFIPVGYGTLQVTAALSRPGGGTWLPEDFSSGGFTFGVVNYRYDDAAHPVTTIKCTYLALRIEYVDGVAPVANFTATPTSGTAPLTVDFTDTSTNTPSSWAWDFTNNGSTDSTTQSPQDVVYAAEGTYTVKLTATNATGSDEEIKTGYITVLPVTTDVVAAFNATPTSGRNPMTVQFTNLSTGDPVPTTWLWSFGDPSGSTSTAQHPQFTYAMDVGGGDNVSQSFTVSLTATRTGGGGDDTDTETKTNYILLTVGAPIPSIAVSPDPARGGVPLTVAFTGSTTVGVPDTWTWDFKDGSGTSPEQSPTHVFTKPGNYEVSLTTRNYVGALSTNLVWNAGTPASSTSVFARYTSPDPDFTQDRRYGRLPLTVHFTDLTTGDVESWLWNFGDGNTSTLQNPTHTYTTDGSFTVALTVTRPDIPSDKDLATELNKTFTETKTTHICADPIGQWRYHEFLWELAEHLMEPTATGTLCDLFVKYGGCARVVTITKNRLTRFLLETGLLRKTATVVSSSGNVTLPSDLIEIRRVSVGGVAIGPVDVRLADLDSGLSAQDVPYGYTKDPKENPLQITLVPALNGISTKITYVYCPAITALPADCTCPDETADPWALFPLPYVFWWPVKYAVLGELLSQEGEMKDAVRAEQCNALYSEGVQLINFLWGNGA